MKKLIFILIIIFISCNAPVEDEKYNFKYAIETNESITTNVTYLYEDKYITKQIQTIDANIPSLNVTQSYWESPPQTIQDDYYAYIEIDDSHNQAGWFYFIVNDEIFDYSYISNLYSPNIFAWYLDLNNDGF